jgi:hypothetical protein
MHRIATAVFAFALSFSLDPLGSGDFGQVAELNPPVNAGSAEPNLVMGKRHVYLSWLEKLAEGGHALRFSRWDGQSWTPARTIISGAPFFVNWADFPSMLELEDGSLAAHWLQKNGSGTYSYDVMLSRSSDGGLTWSKGSSPHRPGIQAEHGFVSLVDHRGAGRFSVVWLDGDMGGASAHGHGALTGLKFSSYEKESFSSPAVLDAKVCDCCQTAAVRTRSGIFVAYRDRSDDEIRDISYVRFTDGKWSEPQTLNHDRWQISGCPVNGPAASADGDRLVVAWYTMGEQALSAKTAGGASDLAQPAGDRQIGRVMAIFSEDGGKTFGAPVRVDSRPSLGRVDVRWIGDGTAVVSWLETAVGGASEIRAGQVNADGRMETPIAVAQTTGARSSGFPRMSRLGKDLLLAWTQVGETTRVRVSQIKY